MRRRYVIVGLAVLLAAVAALAYPHLASTIAAHWPVRVGPTIRGGDRDVDITVAFANNGRRGTLPDLLATHPALGESLAKQLPPLLAANAAPRPDQFVVGTYRIVAAARTKAGIDIYAQSTYGVFAFAGGRLFEGGCSGGFSGPVRIRLTRDLQAVAIDEPDAFDDDDGSSIMPSWVATRINGMGDDRDDEIGLQKMAGRVVASRLPRLVHLPAPDHANPLRDQTHVYANGPLDDANSPDPPDLYAMGAIPDPANGFAVRVVGAPQAAANPERLMSSPDRRFVCYLSLDGPHGLYVHDVLKHAWLAIDGPSLLDEADTWTAAWAGDTLVFDIVDVGFSEPRPPVLTKTHVEVDLSARRVTRVVPFGPYTGNWSS